MKFFTSTHLDLWEIMRKEIGSKVVKISGGPTEWQVVAIATPKILFIMYFSAVMLFNPIYNCYLILGKSRK